LVADFLQIIFVAELIMTAAVTNAVVVAPAVAIMREARAADHGADTAAHDRADGTGD
jgi:hypothetical protein